MARTTLTGERLSLKDKFVRLRDRVKDPEWRRYGITLASGKLLGLVVVIGMMLALPMLLTGTFVKADTQVVAPAPVATPAATVTPAVAPAPAPAAPVVLAKDIINPLNTLWTLIAAFLVFAMQVGFVMLEAGFCRSRETVNVLVECVFDTCL